MCSSMVVCALANIFTKLCVWKGVKRVREKTKNFIKKIMMQAVENQLLSTALFFVDGKKHA